MHKFTHEDPEFKVEVTVYNDAVTWIELLKYVQQYLNGCGFMVDPLKVDIADVVGEAHDEAMDKVYKDGKERHHW
jgi:expansin (peptidoglycan-binding protein)